MANNNNFDLILAIPCMTVKDGKKKPEDTQDISSIAPLYLEDIEASYLEDIAQSSLKSIENPLKCGGIELEVRNNAYDDKLNLAELAETFCKQIEKHREYELIFYDKSSNIKINRAPLLFGQIILYKDEINSKDTPECCYNFFCVVSELTINKGSDSGKNAFNTIYVVVPDITYADLTLMMDESFELWCNINGNTDTQKYLTDYLDSIGYKYFGKIYRIVFSDINQYKIITENETNKTKIYNILAAESYRSKDIFSHQIELSESTTEYILSLQGKARDISLSKKEKFFDDYNMYCSYKAYASPYSYYYILNEEGKDIFRKRIEPDEDDEDFSSEANILFVLETELFKISAGLTLSNKINEQINNPNMREIQKMFKGFINTRPLFEKLTYCYLGAQKEADFIHKQFRIGDILADYDRKRELLKSYCEVSTSITENTNSKVLNCIGLLFTFISGFGLLRALSHIAFGNEDNIQLNTDFVIPFIVLFVILVYIAARIFPLVRLLKRFIKSLFGTR